MRRRYKIVLNLDVTDPDKPYPAGGDYTHLNRIDGAVKYLQCLFSWTRPEIARVSLDKIIDKGEISDSLK